MEKEVWKSFLPQDKFDIAFLSRIESSKLDKKIISLIIPELFFWMADMNWPVAKYVVYFLCQYSALSIPYIKMHLERSETDDDLKYFVISNLIPQLDVVFQNELFPYVERIVINPTEIERQGSYEAAAFWLEHIKNMKKRAKD